MNTRWHDLIQRYISGNITDAEARVLEQQLKLDPELRDWYLDALNLDSALEAAAESAQAVLSLPMPISQRALMNAAASPAKPWRMFLPSAAAAAALVFCGALLWQVWGRDAKIAELVDVQRARWDGSTLSTEPGSRLGVGRLRLAEGLACLRFARGAEVTLEGPAELELVGEQVCRLHRGSLVAHVPEAARGFSVLTRSAMLIDYGTEFGITADASGQARVHVMQGEVELRHTMGSTPIRLTARQMTDITLNDLRPPRPFETEPRLSDMPLAADGFTATLTTRVGRGAAAYVSEPRTGENQSDSLLLLKNCAEPGYGRKVLLRFDLGEMSELEPVREAQLVLNFGPTGLGYASHGDEARIAVYALIDDLADEWEAASVSWDTQPAFAADAGGVDERKAVRIGSFTVPRGVQTGAFTIDSPHLVSRIRADANRLLTLVLVRENRIEVGGGLVLGIAGNRHPMLPPPTLRVR